MKKRKPFNIFTGISTTKASVTTESVDGSGDDDDDDDDLETVIVQGKFNNV
jgi:hypothetical protein